MYDMGARLRTLRKAKGWSQETLGRKLNKTKSVVSSYEANLRTPPLDVLTDLAALYGVSLDYLAGVEGRAMLPAEGLTSAQTELVRTIILELQSPHPGAARTLTPRQMDILNGLLFEFTRRGWAGPAQAARRGFSACFFGAARLY